MKIKKLLAFGTAALLALSGCSRNGADIIINVDGYEGIVLATDNTAADAVPIPDKPVFTFPPDTTQTEEGETVDGSGETEPVDVTVQTESSAPVHIDPEPHVTAAATEALWTETPQSGTMYVNTDGIYSRVSALLGSARVDKYDLNQAVEILAKTNTDYFKVSGGAFIHADYLSTERVPVDTQDIGSESQSDIPAFIFDETDEPVTAEPPETDPPVTTEPAEEGLTPIMGSSSATAEQMVRYIKKMNPEVEASVIEMIPYYLSEGVTEGVRGDIAFAQSCIETGYFRFEKTGTGSAVTIDQNNFCGMGVTSLGIKGESFDTPQLGIRAQIQHLKAYASTLPLNGVRVDNRFNYVVRGCAPYVEWLGMQENPSGKGWAGGKNYGAMILNIYNNILAS